MCHPRSRSDRLLEHCSIALVGKYTKFSDSYASVIKALEHSALAISHKLEVKVIIYQHCSDYKQEFVLGDPLQRLRNTLECAYILNYLTIHKLHNCKLHARWCCQPKLAALLSFFPLSFFPFDPLWSLSFSLLVCRLCRLGARKVAGGASEVS